MPATRNSPTKKPAMPATRSSPKKNKALSVSAQPKKAPTARRCRRCPGLPLLTECAHSRSGKQGDSPPQAPYPMFYNPAYGMPPSFAPNQYPAGFQNGMIPGPWMFNFPSLPVSGATGPAVDQASPIADGNIDPSLKDNSAPQSVPTSAFGVDLSSLDDEPAVAEVEGQSEGAEVGAAGHEDIQDGEDGQGDESAQVGEGGETDRNREGVEGGGADRDKGGEAGGEGVEGEQPRLSAPKPKKRLFPSDTKAIFGHVEGVGCGINGLKLARKRHLKGPLTTQKAVTKNYKEWLRDLMTRGENIATRTGAWVYIAAHHPSSRHPFYHYTSPKLRREAPANVEGFHKEISITMTALMRSERKAKVEALDEALREGERADKAEEELKKAREKLRKLEEKLGMTQGGEEELDNADPIEFDDADSDSDSDLELELESDAV